MSVEYGCLDAGFFAVTKQLPTNVAGNHGLGCDVFVQHHDDEKVGGPYEDGKVELKACG